MKKEVIILIAEDDEGHATLMKKNLLRSGFQNKIIRFSDGQQVLDFFFGKDSFNDKKNGNSYLLILDIRMPKVSGIEVLKRIKSSPDFKKIPTIMLTTTDNPSEINECYKLGCNTYMTKPMEYGQFINAIVKLGMFFTIIEIPKVNDSLEYPIS